MYFESWHGLLFSKFDSHFFEVRQKVAQILQGVLGQQISHLDVLLDAQEHDVGVQLGDCILELVLFQCLGAEFTVGMEKKQELQISLIVTKKSYFI